MKEQEIAEILLKENEEYKKFMVGKFLEFYKSNADYQERSKEKFKDNLIGNIYISLVAACLIPIILLFQEDKLFIRGY